MELKQFLLSLITIYISARVMGEFAVRLGQPAVLGELVAGVLLGASVLGVVQEAEPLKLFGEIGVQAVTRSLSGLTARRSTAATGTGC